MRKLIQLLALVLICMTSAADAGQRSSVVAIINANVNAMIDTTPALPDTLAPKQDDTKIELPKTFQPVAQFDGMPVADFIVKWYRGRSWTHPGTITDHLRQHGASELCISLLGDDQREKLHAAIHEKELAERKITTGTIVGSAPAVTSGCPGGNCPTQNYQRRRGK